MNTLLLTLYVTAVSLLALYGAVGMVTFWLYWRHRHNEPCSLRLAQKAQTDLPPVTVQLPIYNERYVVRRLIDAAVSLQYPSDKLQIQVIDDSTDETTRLAADLVTRYQRQGHNIQLIHRSQRHGYKAGALAAALNQASGEFIAIFDADFQPKPDFLQQTIPYFLQNDQLGMIQARWGHLNDQQSPLTAAQAIAIDKHFAMEQMVRHRARLYPKFNGAGGIWRRRCMEDAGGWQDDTVCEDLCLSTRATLRGWEFHFLPDVITPAELPASIVAYKTQQARWAKGSSQCLLKFGAPILADKKHSLLARFYALFAMSAYNTHLLLIAILLLQLPLIFTKVTYPSWILLLSLAGLGQPLLFVTSQIVLYEDWPRRLRHFPTLMLVAIGLAPTNARAIVEAILKRPFTFTRTPKHGNQSVLLPYQTDLDWIVTLELFFMLYALVGLMLALWQNQFGPVLFLTTCVLGFGYVSYLTLREYSIYFTRFHHRLESGD